MEHHGDESQQLVGLSAVAQRQNHVLISHHTQVAVINVEWINVEGRSSCRCQGGSDLGSYVSTLSYTGHDDFSLAVVHQVDSLLEVVVQQCYLV